MKWYLVLYTCSPVHYSDTQFCKTVYSVLYYEVILSSVHLYTCTVWSDTQFCTPVVYSFTKFCTPVLFREVISSSVHLYTFTVLCLITLLCCRRPLNHTDSWLEKHFGSPSSLSQSGSSELSRPGSRDGPGGLRRWWWWWWGWWWRGLWWWGWRWWWW